MIYFHNNIPSFGMSTLQYQETNQTRKNYLQGILYTTIYMNVTLPWLDMGLGGEVRHLRSNFPICN